MWFKQRYRILLVNGSEADSYAVRRNLSKAVRSSFDVDWADTLEAGLYILAQRAPGACLVDDQLGKYSGADFLRCAQDLGFRVPLVLLTGAGNLDAAREALDRGAIDYLDKNDLSPPLLERSLRYAIETFGVQEALKKASEQLEERVRQRTAELERSNEELEHFAYLVSHELQLPLKTITSHIEQMKQQVPTCANCADDGFDGYFLDRAHEGAQRMARMIRSVLEYSRVGKGAPARDIVHAKDVLQDVLADLGQAIADKDAKIEIGGLPVLCSDRILLGQLFKNLIGNALKFSGETRPRIRIWAEQRENFWLCSVQDEGCGIPVERTDEVFLMFHRAHTPHAVSGDGIGLALCKRIVEHHGGKIWVESKPGAGATFRFTFPTSGIAAAVKRTQDRKEAATTEPSGMVAAGLGAKGERKGEGKGHDQVADRR